jgi:hypothetical protein
MHIQLLCLLFAAAPQPRDSIALGQRFECLECYRDVIYLSPLIGTSIFQLSGHDSMVPISFTDDLNYRVMDFRITPFSIYINRGNALEKYYLSSGTKETVFASTDISSFDLTPAEEIVLADRQRNEIVFLDFTYRVKFKLENILVRDLRWYDTLLYVLTKNSIFVYDEYGNLTDRKYVPEICTKIDLIDHKIIIFTEKANYLYLNDTTWVRKEFPFAILDVCERKGSLVILDGFGTTLRTFDRNGF